MKTLTVAFFLVVTTSVFAQTTRSFGSVVFPGGATSPGTGIVRNFGSVVFPGSSAVPTVRGGNAVVGGHPGVGVGGIGVGVVNPVPGQKFVGGNGRRGGISGSRNSRNIPYVYAYPTYVGGSYDSSYGNGYAEQDQAPMPPQQPNVTVVYPPSQRANPTMIQAGPDGQYYTTGEQRQGAMIYDAQRSAQPEEDQEPAADGNRFLIAFKDHTIYTAVAYWVDGETLHYFTTGTTHNQVSVSLIDRELTERLNKELGIDFKLPPPAK